MCLNFRFDEKIFSASKGFMQLIFFTLFQDLGKIIEATQDLIKSNTSGCAETFESTFRRTFTVSTDWKHSFEKNVLKMWNY